MNQTKHPGVYVPPPLIYVAFFIFSVWMQKIKPLGHTLLDTPLAKIVGILLIAMYLILFISALKRFLLSKNTIVTIKPAHSLETSGIYSFTRNPMYLSLLFLYSGLAVFIGNWWTLIFLPLLILVVQWYVIRKEEMYLQHAFGNQYDQYSKKVRRWI